MSLATKHKPLYLGRNFLVTTVILAVLVLAIDLFLQDLWSERQLGEQEIEVTLKLGAIRTRIEESLYANLLLLHGMAAHIAIDPDITDQVFSDLAREIMRQPNMLVNLAAAPDFIIKYVYPLKGNEALIGVDYQKLPQQWAQVRSVKETGRMTVSGPLDLVQGGQGVIGRTPVFVRQGENLKFWGLVSGIIDMDRLLARAGITAEATSLELAIRGRDGKGDKGEVFWGNPKMFSAERRAITMMVSFPSGTWQLAAVPRHGWLDNHTMTYLIHAMFLVLFLGANLAWYWRLHTESQIKQVEANLSRSQATAHLGSWEWTPQTDVMTWSEETRRIFGDRARKKRLKLDDFMENFPDGDRTALKKAILEALAKGSGSFRLELQTANRENKPRILSLICQVEGEKEQSPRVFGTIQDITENKRIQENLDEARKHIYNILESTTDAFFEVDADFNLTYINKRAEKSLGITGRDDLGQKLWDLFPLMMESVFYHEYHRALKEQQVVTFEAYYAPLEVWYQVWAYPTPQSLSVYFHDITVRKRLQQERENIFQLSLDMICIAGFDGYFKDLNPAWEKVLGWSKKELLAREWLYFVHPDDRASTIQAGRDLSAGEKVVSFENRYESKSGGYKWLSWNSYPDRELNVIYAVARDVTETKEYEEAIIAKEERFRVLAENLPLGIALNDREGRVLYFNPGFTRILGYTLADIPRIENWWILAYPEEQYRRETEQMWTNTVSLSHKKNTKTPTFERTVTDKQGEKKTIEFQYIPLGAMGMTIFHDVTVRRKTEAALLKAHEELEKRVEQRTAELAETNIRLEKAKEAAETASRAKTEFLANISHELRTPLNPIIGLTDLLIEMNDKAEFGVFLEDIRTSAGKLLNMINGLIEISQIDAQGLEMDPLPFSPKSLLQAIFGDLTKMIGSKEIRLLLHLDEKIPAALKGDSAYLRKALDRILENAAKFTEKGEIRLSVFREKEISSDQEAWVRFSISDTGQGIAPDRLNTLSQDLTQADGSMTRKYGGLGLGLTLVRRIVSHMGGEIRAESVEGQRTTFHLLLPFGLVDDLGQSKIRDLD